MFEAQKPIQIDETDKQLLFALQRNARLSFAELGRIVGLTATAVSERVRKLEDAGVIQGYHTAVSLPHLGYPITVFIRLRINQFADETAVTQTLQIPEVIASHSLTGDDCMLLKIVATSVDHMRQVLAQISKMGDTTTSIELYAGEKKEILQSLQAAGPPFSP
ncbi:MAG: Lrp/AsnC family transcriptional regulator [Chloroflexota bacterium]